MEVPHPAASRNTSPVTIIVVLVALALVAVLGFLAFSFRQDASALEEQIAESRLSGTRASRL